MHTISSNRCRKVGVAEVISHAEMFCSFPMSSADAQRFSMEENEAQYSGKIRHYCPHHIYSNQEMLGLTLSKPSECVFMNIFVLYVTIW